MKPPVRQIFMAKHKDEEEPKDDRSKQDEAEGMEEENWEEGPGDEVLEAAGEDDALDEGRRVKPEAEEPMTCRPCGNERKPSMIKAPIMPPAHVVEAHNVTHLPPRPWCEICVKTKAVEDAHCRVKGTGEEGGLPVFTMDYNTLNESDALHDNVLIGKLETRGDVVAHHVVAKGPSDEWVARRIIKDLEELGAPNICLETDGEPALVALQAKIQAMRPGSTVPCNPPAYNPQANGACEKAVRDYTEHLSTVLLALACRIGRTIDRRRRWSNGSLSMLHF